MTMDWCRSESINSPVSMNINGTLTLWSDDDRYGHIAIYSKDINCTWKVLTKVYKLVR